MSTGPEHYLEAERLLGLLAVGQPFEEARIYLLAAQAHATLALVAATTDSAPSSFSRAAWGTTTSPDEAKHVFKGSKQSFPIPGERKNRITVSCLCSCGWSDPANYPNLFEAKKSWREKHHDPAVSDSSEAKGE